MRHKKRVLIVTYDFPPVGGSGVQRVAKFATYLPDFGWEPVVLTTRHGRPIPRDATLLEGLAGLETHKTPAPHPYRFPAVVKRWLGRRHDPDSFTADMESRRGPLHPTAWLIPDGKIVWIPFGLAWALLRRSRARCDVVLSSVPTPSAAVLGWLISRLWGVPHVIDYRDPWNGALYIPRRIPPLHRLEAAWERRIVEQARAVVTVPHVYGRLPRLSTPVEVIHNGFDERDFADAQPKHYAEGFVIAHVGLLWKDRDLGPLMDALIRLQAERPEISRRVQVVQVGRVDAHVKEQLDELRRNFGLSHLRTVPHSEAVACMLGADLLYLPTIEDYIPGKTYEYLRSGTPILALGGRSSHLHELLSATGGGRAFEPTDVAGIARFIESSMTAPGSLRCPAPEVLASYSREAGTRALARVLDRVARSSGPVAAPVQAEQVPSRNG